MPARPASRARSVSASRHAQEQWSGATRPAECVRTSRSEGGNAQPGRRTHDGEHQQHPDTVSLEQGGYGGVDAHQDAEEADARDGYGRQQTSRCLVTSEPGGAQGPDREPGAREADSGTEVGGEQRRRDGGASQVSQRPQRQVQPAHQHQGGAGQGAVRVTDELPSHQPQHPGDQEQDGGQREASDQGDVEHGARLDVVLGEHARHWRQAQDSRRQPGPGSYRDQPRRHRQLNCPSIPHGRIVRSNQEQPDGSVISPHTGLNQSRPGWSVHDPDGLFVRLRDRIFCA